jgi:hypothetical protein
VALVDRHPRRAVAIVNPNRRTEDVIFPLNLVPDNVVCGVSRDQVDNADFGGLLPDAVDAIFRLQDCPRGPVELSEKRHVCAGQIETRAASGDGQECHIGLILVRSDTKTTSIIYLRFQKYFS